MKRIIAILAIIISFSVSLSAQTAAHDQLPDPKNMARNSAEQLALKLKLAPAQKDKVLQILLDHNTSIVKALKENQNNPQAMGAIASKLTAESDAKINLVLRTDQKKLFKEFKDQRMADMQKRMTGQGSPRP